MLPLNHKKNCTYKRAEGKRVWNFTSWLRHRNKSSKIQVYLLPQY